MEKNIKKEIDIIVIGSSPRIFMNVIEYAKQGKKIAIIDNSKDLGGNWRVVDLTTVNDVEYGCFLIPDRDNIYEYLEQTMHIPLIEYEHQPCEFFGNKQVPLGSGLYNAIYRFDANKNIKTFLSLAFQFVKYPFVKKEVMKHPKKGIRSILDSYDFFINKYNIDVFCSQVDSVHISFENKEVILRCTNNSSFIASKVLMGVGTFGLDKITSDRMNFYTKNSMLYSSMFTFILLKLKTKNKGSFSYVKVTNEYRNKLSEDILSKIDFYHAPHHNRSEHKILHRITNITDYSYQPHNKNDDYMLLSIETDGWLPKEGYEKKLVEYTIQYIQTLNLIEKNIGILEFSFERKKLTSMASIEKILRKYYKPYLETTNTAIL